MTTQRTDFVMYQGDSKVLSVTVADEDGQVVSVDGMTIRWQASPVITGGFDTTATLKKDNDALGGITTVTEEGVFEVEIEPEDTESLSGLYYHEAELTDGTGHVSTVLTGRMTIKPVLIRAGG
ncbi:MAG: hypothetical protein E5Y67_03540 [Mesorhizobium sp.]|uniref:hypothetical protein n=1 Tax=Mesorhizobium sp. TaxID=1871066 RepID=UPI00122AE1F3|nr:hypothetical protein [Mesorhizobium sp.]TIM16278.1 MAG: hypothetical protein E5Y67_03540 [Mesorhizobium sp.]